MQNIKQLLNLSPDWHSCGAAPPNAVAICNAVEILSQADIKGIIPQRISPSTDEGVRISFKNKDNNVDIECYNTGEIYVMTYSGNEKPDIGLICFDRADELAEKIVAFLTL